MPATERKRRYTSLVAQVALLMTHRCFVSDAHNVIETIIVNGHLATTDKRTGRDINPCLVTARTTRDSFAELDLARVDPIECLKGLSASISRSPAELVPVRPIIEFDMADLIDGGNLLYLLHEHAEIDAKIEAPEDWVDPPLPS